MCTVTDHPMTDVMPGACINVDDRATPEPFHHAGGNHAGQRLSLAPTPL
jgi:hypothetical protein